MVWDMTPQKKLQRFQFTETETQVDLDLKETGFELIPFSPRIMVQWKTFPKRKEVILY